MSDATVPDVLKLNADFETVRRQRFAIEHDGGMMPAEIYSMIGYRGERSAKQWARYWRRKAARLGFRGRRGSLSGNELRRRYSIGAFGIRMVIQ